ncbi:MAG: 16S rRNA (cytidine(1402)-2'-O)-methyltransferase, partial [bacterium]|nr:16S rRNA (cytidine(1402)-2'-O)-methyltransferase [bacterium]
MRDGEGASSTVCRAMGAGMLYFVGTPIGNLEDVTLRAQRVLREVKAIGAEDTRRTRQLLSRFGIETPLFSFHRHNERARTEEIVARLRAGEDIAIVSDAGMPLISDAGAVLAARLCAEGIAFTCVPGPSAVETALVVSGLGGGPFQFLGFVPREAKGRERLCEELRKARLTSVLFESPQRLVKTLGMLGKELGERRIAVARELTKVHEEVVRGTGLELAGDFGRGEGRGECVIVGAACEG